MSKARRSINSHQKDPTRLSEGDNDTRSEGKNAAAVIALSKRKSNKKSRALSHQRGTRRLQKVLRHKPSRIPKSLQYTVTRLQKSHIDTSAEHQNSTKPDLSLQKLLVCDFCQRSIVTHLTNHSHSTCYGVPLLD